ncbi:MAG: nucleotidyltransferase domain-containing protein [Oceanicaulis sp.]
MLRSAQPELSKRYGVSGIRVFGSVARGEAKASSDIDVAVEFSANRDPLAILGAAGLIGDQFDVQVDVVKYPVRNAELAHAIETDGVRAF